MMNSTVIESVVVGHGTVLLVQSDLSDGSHVYHVDLHTADQNLVTIHAEDVEDAQVIYIFMANRLDIS